MALPNPLLQQLGKQLQTYRERAGLEYEDVDANPRLGWYVGKCLRVEAGTRGVTPAELHVLADQVALTDLERTGLLALAERARKRVRVQGVAEWARPIVLLEHAAQEFDYFDEVLIPAVLQAPGYARDLLSKGQSADLEERVAARLERGGLLTKPNAPQVRVLLGEAAVHRLPNDPGVALEQLERLLAATSLDVLELRILPWSHGLHALLGFACNIFRLANPDVTQVYLEIATNSTLVTEPADTAVYQGRFDQLFEAALDEDESARLLRERIRQLRTRRRNDDPNMGSA